jgi:Raf kinase inhibitor-like YbhB/YbcL family protein
MLYFKIMTQYKVILNILILFIICTGFVDVQAESKRSGMMSLTITSPAFSHDGSIPAVYTCDGKDISPELNWSDIPENAKSLVLIVDDPDAPDPAAPKITWVHWVLYSLPASSSGLAEGINASELPEGTLEGLNDWKRTGYGGPCPPIGRHRYFHKLYVLDTVLPDLNQPTKAEVEAAMEDHIIEQAILIGTYQH